MITISNCLTFLLVFAIVCGVKVKVAVYEHVVISPDNAEKMYSRDEAFDWMLKNLMVIREQAHEASKQGSKLIVFPEYGVTGFDHSRDSIVPFLENIPDVTSDWTPCDQPDRHKNTSVIRHLSCSAKKANIYIVANMGDIKPCHKNTHIFCPKDGRYQFNTNVVFDNNGKLIARYHKRNLYDEMPLFDPSPTIEYTSFQTPFGMFGTVVCFDLLHYYPTQRLLQKYDIKNLLVTSAWNVFYPFIVPIQMYSGLAKRNNINVIASNIRHEPYAMASSGIFGPSVEVSTSTDFTNPSGVLLISELETEPQITDNVKSIQPIGTLIEIKGIMNETMTGTYEYGMNMTFSVLEKNNEFAVACGETVCCAVQYQFNMYDGNEMFIVSASDFEMTIPGAIHFQFCAVHRCASRDPDSCGEAISDAKSTFTRIKLQAYFDNALVFPFVSTTPFGNHSFSTEMENYQFDKENAIIQSESFEHPPLAIAIYNTLYIREPESSLSGSVLTTDITCLKKVMMLSLLLFIMCYI